MPNRPLHDLLDRATPALFAASLLLAWEAACRVFAIPPSLLPSPSAIVQAAYAYPAHAWATSIWSTLRVSLLGLALACAVAIPLAMALVTSRLLTRTLYPLLVVHSTPIVAIAPIPVVVPGAGDLSRVAITFLPMVVAAATRRREMLNIRLPFAIPYVFAALRIAATPSVIGAVVAEFVAAEEGLGCLRSYSALAALAIISLLLFQAVTWLQRAVFPLSLPPQP